MVLCWYSSASCSLRWRLLLALNSNPATRITRTITPATTPAISPVWLESEEDPELFFDAGPEVIGGATEGMSFVEVVTTVVVVVGSAVVVVVVITGAVVFFGGFGFLASIGAAATSAGAAAKYGSDA